MKNRGSTFITRFWSYDHKELVTKVPDTVIIGPTSSGLFERPEDRINTGETIKQPLKNSLKNFNHHFLLKCLTLVVGVMLISLYILYHSHTQTPGKNPEAKNTSDGAPTILDKARIDHDEPQTDQTETKMSRLNLPLTLISTSARDKTSAYAVIRNNTTGEDTLFRQDDTIGPAILTEIHEHSVQLRKGVAEQTLYLSATEPHPGDMDSDTQHTPPLSPEEIAQRYNFDDDIKEVMGLMTQIDVVSSQTSIESNGVIITRIQKDSVFERIGLEVNDMILSIDDKKIESVDDSMEIYETLRTSPNGTILILRNNQPETLVYQSSYL